MSTPGTPLGPTPPAGPTQQRRTFNEWRADHPGRLASIAVAILGVVLVAVIGFVFFVGPWHIGTDGKPQGGIVTSAPVDTTNAPPVPSISPTPTATTTSTPTPSPTVISTTPAPTSSTTVATAHCAPFNPHGLVPPRTIEAPVAAAAKQAAACNFASVWEYQARLPITREPQAAYADAVKLCKDAKVKGAAKVLQLAKIYKADARGFYVAAVTTLCPGHDKTPLKSSLDLAAQKMQTAFDTTRHNPLPITWNKLKSASHPRGIAPPQRWVYGQFIKETCAHLTANGGDQIELKAHLMSLDKQLRLLNYDATSTGSGYDSFVLNTAVDQAIAAGCPKLG